MMITGGCLCGQVRYQADTEPLFGVICHCRDCQRASGSSHMTVMGVAKDALKVTGETKVFSSVGGSGQPNQRHFCPNCGATLLGTGDSFPTMTMIYAGSLDDPSLFVPQSQINVKDRHGWNTGPAHLPAFHAMPTE